MNLRNLPAHEIPGVIAELVDTLESKKKELQVENELNQSSPTMEVVLDRSVANEVNSEVHLWRTRYEEASNQLRLVTEEMESVRAMGDEETLQLNAPNAIVRNMQRDMRGATGARKKLDQKSGGDGGAKTELETLRAVARADHEPAARLAESSEGAHEKARLANRVISFLEEKVIDMERNLASEQEEHSRTQQDLSQCLEERDSLQSKLQTTQDTIQARDTAVAELKAEAEKAQGQLATAQTETCAEKDLKRKLNEAKAKNELCEETVKGLRVDLDEKRGESVAFVVQISSILCDKKEELRRLKLERNRDKEEAEGLKKRILQELLVYLTAALPTLRQVAGCYPAWNEVRIDTQQIDEWELRRGALSQELASQPSAA
ncbi:hypothetical protein GLOTRDRAFT_91299 [Gloeophyllum trabeum ATCC 11539]|uniref:Uncharacterized protein n=1 Tax=Gloeophyllum trabeum (strain ATCC 11539 / FP-39264 / Madison 617) TaxID=670483 RepID=S7QKP3_GLOTA|nr:uncharacterized protein GLOTRDRAFT_91299 [Gloeophyllum trabeum ATCC 11539]EPQ59823.1 hypothetical protein GLOTRDRAFT_91299 [Gloeophyllum trabeum ATCC 11539]